MIIDLYVNKIKGWLITDSTAKEGYFQNSTSWNHTYTYIILYFKIVKSSTYFYRLFVCYMHLRKIEKKQRRFCFCFGGTHKQKFCNCRKKFP